MGSLSDDYIFPRENLTRKTQPPVILERVVTITNLCDAFPLLARSGLADCLAPALTICGSSRTSYRRHKFPGVLVVIASDNYVTSLTV